MFPSLRERSSAKKHFPLARLWHNFDDMEGKRRNRRERRQVEIADSARLEALALTYVARYATTRGKLLDYLRRKLREADAGHLREEADKIADKMAERGYVNDEAFAEMRTSSLARRGYGPSRIRMALQHSGIVQALAQESAQSIDAEDAARAFAAKKRYAAFGSDEAERKRLTKAMAAMARAGHSFELSRRILQELRQTDD
jgi:regulatory protein